MRTPIILRVVRQVEAERRDALDRRL